MKDIRYTVYGKTYTLSMQGESVEEDGHASEHDEYGTHPDLDAAVEEAREIAGAAGAVELRAARGKGIGYLSHAVVWVDAFAYDEDSDEWLSCDADGEVDECGAADSVYYHDCLDDRPDIKAAWDRAVRSKYDYMDYKADEFYTAMSFLEEMEG